MADTKISAAADPGTLVATDKVPMARSASTTAYAATLTEVATYAHSTLTTGTGIANTGGTISNAGVLTIDAATGAILIGAGLVRNTQTLSVAPATTLALGGVIAGANTTINAGGTLSVAAPGAGGMSGPIVAGTGLTGGTIASTGTIGLAPATSSVLGGVIAGTGITINAGGTITAAPGGGGMSGPIVAGTGLTGGTITAAGTIGLAAATGSTLGGVVTGANITNTAGTISVANPGTGTVTSVVAGTGLSGGTITATGTLANTGVLSIDSATGAILLGTGLTRTSQTISTTSTVTVGLSNNLTDVIPVGTYDLGPVLQGGTVLNSYAHVFSGTLTYTGAIGAPGTYTTITGMSALTSTSTTVDTIGTATAANVLSAGQHLWCIIGGTSPPGGTVFFRVKVP